MLEELDQPLDEFLREQQRKLRSIHYCQVLQKLGRKKFDELTPYAFAVFMGSASHDPDWVIDRCLAVLDANSWDEVLPQPW